MDTDAVMKKAGVNGVTFTTRLELSTGHAIALAWYAATGAALREDQKERVAKLFEAALSLPIRVR